MKAWTRRPFRVAKPAAREVERSRRGGPAAPITPRLVPFRLGLVAALLASGACHRSVNLAITRVELGTGNYFVGTGNAQPSLEKVLVYVPGTGQEPASRHFGIGAEATLQGYAVVYPEKSFLEDDVAFHRADHREQRLSELVAVIDDLERRGMRRLLILAASEGTMVAHELAARYPSRVAGVICMAGSVTPFRDDLRWTSSHRSGPSTPFTLDALEHHLAAIDADPANLERDFWGHTFRFWSSQLDYDPKVHLRQARWPVLFLNGELDDLDLPRQELVLEELRAGGVDIESIRYPGVGHRLDVLGARLSTDLSDWARRKGL